MDPEVARALAELPEGPPVGDDPSAARELLGLLARRAVRDGRVRVDDRVWAGGAAQPMPVRVYTPAERTDPAPVAVWFHGGAFVLGGLDSDDITCYRVAARLGVVVVSVDYRLAPEHPYPAAVEDGYAALEQAVRQAEALGADRARVAVGGHSSGGCLAAAVALLARDRGGPPLALQYLGYPALDDRVDTPSAHAVVDRRIWNRDGCLAMWRTYLAGRPATPYAAPARAEDLSRLPPAYVWAVEHDPLRDEALDYAARLAQSGVPTELHLVPGAFHGFEALVPQAPPARRAVEAWLGGVAAALGTTVREGDPLPSPLR